MDEQFGLSFGAFAAPIREQLEEQGLAATGISPEIADELKNALIFSLVNGLLTDSEIRKAHQRLMKRLKVVKKEANK